MEEGKWFWEMDAHMMEIEIMINKLDSVYLSGEMGKNMKVFGKIMLQMERE